MEELQTYRYERRRLETFQVCHLAFLVISCHANIHIYICHEAKMLLSFPIQLQAILQAWPANAKVEAWKMAKAGLRYTGQEEEVPLKIWRNKIKKTMANRDYQMLFVLGYLCVVWMRSGRLAVRRPGRLSCCGNCATFWSTYCSDIFKFIILILSYLTLSMMHLWNHISWFFVKSNFKAQLRLLFLNHRTCMHWRLKWKQLKQIKGWQQWQWVWSLDFCQV